MKFTNARICSICKQEKSSEHFWKYKGKLFSSCKECNSKIKKEYYSQNKNRFNEYGKKYYRRVVAIDSVRHICYNTLYQHKRKGYQIGITLEELIDMAHKVDYCGLCLQKLDKTLGDKGTCHRDSLSFDCINNEKDFVKDNIQVICNLCNIRKKRSKRKNKNRRNVNLYLKKINTIVAMLLSQKETLSTDQKQLLENYLSKSACVEKNN